MTSTGYDGDSEDWDSECPECEQTEKALIRLRSILLQLPKCGCETNFCRACLIDEELSEILKKL